MDVQLPLFSCTVYITNKRLSVVNNNRETLIKFNALDLFSFHSKQKYDKFVQIFTRYNTLLKYLPN